MIRIKSINDMLSEAYLLAYFIHSDKETAIRIATEAMAKLDVAASVQDKRLYYTPVGRSWPLRAKPDRFRNKVLFSELHLLQRLIYIESESYEMQREQAGDPPALSEANMIVHFVKHLVRITLKRNSFYVTLGLSRLLYNYSTAETMEIYNAVIQDPERVKDDYYYRSRKGLLMQELKERFGNLVSVSRGRRGEERFQTRPSPTQYAELIRQCLSFFTPWNTACLVPAGFDPITDEIPHLSYRGNTEEDKIEVDRIHAILHPDCYQRLTGALRLASPAERLEIPQFLLHKNGDEDPPVNRQHPPKLNDEELGRIKSKLVEQAARRKATSAGLLRIIVDGSERARLDLNQKQNIQLAIESSAELIEVRAQASAGDCVMATHLLTYNESGEEVQPSQA